MTFTKQQLEFIALCLALPELTNLSRMSAATILMSIDFPYVAAQLVDPEDVAISQDDLRENRIRGFIKFHEWFYSNTGASSGTHLGLWNTEHILDLARSIEYNQVGSISPIGTYTNELAIAYPMVFGLNEWPSLQMYMQRASIQALSGDIRVVEYGDMLSRIINDTIKGEITDVHHWSVSSPQVKEILATGSVVDPDELDQLMQRALQLNASSRCRIRSTDPIRDLTRELTLVLNQNIDLYSQQLQVGIALAAHAKTIHELGTEEVLSEVIEQITALRSDKSQAVIRLFVDLQRGLRYY